MHVLQSSWSNAQPLLPQVCSIHRQRTGATCNKENYRQRALNPGLFLIYCLDCENFVGFVAIRSAESPRTLFEVIYIHWPTPPVVVVYDNSCHAMTYALHREPEWFKSVVWIIDAMHFLGHTGCAHCFNIKQQPRLLRLNCEQRVGHSLKGAILVVLLAGCMQTSNAALVLACLKFTSL